MDDGFICFTHSIFINFLSVEERDKKWLKNLADVFDES